VSRLLRNLPPTASTVPNNRWTRFGTSRRTPGRPLVSPVYPIELAALTPSVAGISLVVHRLNVTGPSSSHYADHFSVPANQWHCVTMRQVQRAASCKSAGSENENVVLIGAPEAPVTTPIHKGSPPQYCIMKTGIGYTRPAVQSRKPLATT